MNHFTGTRLKDLWPLGQDGFMTNYFFAPTYKEYKEGKTQKDTEAQEALLGSEDDPQRHSSSPFLKRAFQASIITAKALLVVSYVLLAYYAWTLRKQTCILGNERIFNDIPIVYESTRFQRAGFHDSHHSSLNAYEGAPNEQNNEAWKGLLDVGVVLISDEENSRITNGSATTRSDMHKHIVELEMFHQLHCLKWLRDQFWELDSAISTAKPLIEIPQRQNHTDHCIDYLRQAIICHGDVTPITFEWIPEITGYIAHHTTEHQCRNFDAIHEWAEQRGAPGFRADGKHKNVELKHPEMSD